MAKKKLKLKKKFKITLVVLILLVIGSIIGYKEYQEYKYRQTYEYKFLELNYTKEDITLLLDNMNTNELNSLLNETKNDTLLDLLKEKFFKKENLDRYYAYIDKEDVNASEAVNIVNINRDYDYYELNLTTDVSDGYEMLANKYYLLTSDYIPENLVLIDNNYAWGEDHYIIDTVYDAFKDMWQDAYKEGYYLMINSAYRSYEDQEEVYNAYKEAYGTKYAESIAARPGASEHQTGMALDIFEKSNSSSKTFKDTEVYTWLKENSYKYGFILRYPEGKEDITGYSFESWHYRYVGKETAKKVYDLGITYDEYYANYKN